MKKRSDTAKEKKIRNIQTKSGGKKSNKKEKENCVVESIPPSRVTRSKTVVNSNEIKSSHSGSDTLK